MQRNKLRAAVLLTAFAFLAACGTTRQEALTTTLNSINAARDGFLAYDKDHQERIVQQAENYEDGVADLNKYRVAREPVLRAFVVAYSAVAAAAIDFSNEGAFQRAAQALTELYFAIDSFKESL